LGRDIFQRKEIQGKYVKPSRNVAPGGDRGGCISRLLKKPIVTKANQKKGTRTKKACLRKDSPKKSVDIEFLKIIWLRIAGY